MLCILDEAAHLNRTEEDESDWTSLDGHGHWWVVMLECLCIIALTDLLVLRVVRLEPSTDRRSVSQLQRVATRHRAFVRAQVGARQLRLRTPNSASPVHYTRSRAGKTIVQSLLNSKQSTYYFQPLPDVGPLTSLEEASTSSVVGGVVVKEEVASPLKKKLSENIDVASTPQPSPNPTPTTQRKRKAALEQGNMLRKLKQKMWRACPSCFLTTHPVAFKCTHHKLIKYQFSVQSLFGVITYLQKSKSTVN